MFKKNFDGAALNAVYDGAFITCEVDGIEYTATILADYDEDPSKNDDGFWPSLDPESPGYIGENPEHSFEQQKAWADKVMEMYNEGEMVHCGISITARKNGIEIIPKYMVSLWRLDVNWPNGDNRHLLEVANELLTEAKKTAKSRIKEIIGRLKA